MDNLAAMLGSVLPEGSEAIVVYTEPETGKVALSMHPGVDAVDVATIIGRLETAKFLLLDHLNWEDDE